VVVKPVAKLVPVPVLDAGIGARDFKNPARAVWIDSFGPREIFHKLFLRATDTVVK